MTTSKYGGAFAKFDNKKPKDDEGDIPLTPIENYVSEKGTLEEIVHVAQTLVPATEVEEKPTSLVLKARYQKPSKKGNHRVYEIEPNQANVFGTFYVGNNIKEDKIVLILKE